MWSNPTRPCSNSPTTPAVSVNDKPHMQKWLNNVYWLHHTKTSEVRPEEIILEFIYHNCIIRVEDVLSGKEIKKTNMS